MLKHYKTTITIYVRGKNRKGKTIEIPFEHDDYSSAVIFGNQVVEGFFETKEDFYNKVYIQEIKMLNIASEQVKYTLFTGKSYVKNYYSKIFYPNFITIAEKPETKELKKFSIDYLKKRLSAEQFIKVFK